MNFSLGFFVGGQTLAGILGSLVTLGYGSDGKHGANYMQTTAASVASMSGLAVTVQAFVWLGLPLPPTWQLVVYLTCIGMFGIGVGMLYTPLLVDRLRLTYPSGLAVANILRALTDPRLLRRSVGMLGSGIGAGLLGGVWPRRAALARGDRVQRLDVRRGHDRRRAHRPRRAGRRAGQLGAMPWFVSIGWLPPTDPFRKITFLIALGMILGAAILDVCMVLWQAWQRLRAPRRARDRARSAGSVAARRHAAPARLDRLLGRGGGGLGSSYFGAPVGFLLFALALVFVFALVNGISVGISDSNPISSAFVVTVVLLAALGLRNRRSGLMAATVLLVSTSVACDMQQDRSTGWRLGTNRDHPVPLPGGGRADGRDPGRRAGASSSWPPTRCCGSTRRRCPPTSSRPSGRRR